jgi:nucleotide-binding universal stress UspA family protein
MANSPASVLLALDFSPPSRRALEAAGRLAEDLEARVVVVHAISDGARPKAVKHAVATATAWAQELRARNLAVDVVAEPTPAGEVLVCETAARRGSGIIVMGTRGMTGLKRLALGSFAQAVIRRANVPVLVIPARMAGVKESAAGGNTILVANDFSQDAEVATAAAMRLARDLGATLRLVHTVEIPFATSGNPHSTSGVTPDELARDEEAAAEMLATAASQVRSQGVEAEIDVEVGHPASCILAAARDAGARLVVVGTHGKGALRRMALGSVADQVVQLSDRPVLVVPNRTAGKRSAKRA